MIRVRVLDCFWDICHSILGACDRHFLKDLLKQLLVESNNHQINQLLVATLIVIIGLTLSPSELHVDELI